MRSKNPKSPSKDELLNELESIRDFLGDGSQGPVEIPTLTVIADEHHDESSQANDEPGEQALIDAYKDELDIEPEPEPSKFETERSKPEHKQESLFDSPIVETDADNKESSTSQIDEAELETTLETETDKSNPMPKARGENPFLPPHIRERLGRHKELFEQSPDNPMLNAATGERVEIQGDLLSGFNQATPGLTELQGENIDDVQASENINSEREAIIDAIVAEFLPKIEEKLRAKLRESSFKEEE